MEVAVLYCQDCFFSQRAQAQLATVLDSISGGADRQKLNLAIHAYDAIKDIEIHSKITQIQRSKVQILIISQHFLDRIRHDANARKKASPINRILRPKRVIAILLSVSKEEVIEGFHEYLTQFSDWHTVALNSTNSLDPEFNRKLSEQVIRIYNMELTNTVQFSIFPKKVTKDQPKVIILFKTALRSTDRVHLELSRGRQKEHVGEVMLSNPHAGMIRIPSSLSEDRTSLIEITVFVNNQKLGTKLVKFDSNSKGSDEDVMSKMCLAIPGFCKALDEHVSQQLSKNYSACEDFTLDASLELVNDTLICRSDDFPTVLHFAANYALEQTVTVILYEGDGQDQLDVKNDVGETPADIAQEKGFTTISQTLREFCEMTNTFGALQYIKDLCDRHSEELEIFSGGSRRGSTQSTTTTVRIETSDGIIQEEDFGDEDIFDQSNPAYMLTNGLPNEDSNSIDMELTNEELGSDDIESASADQLSRRHTCDLNIRNHGPINYVNVTLNTDIDSKQALRDQLLKSYDIPPPPNPVGIVKPPRKMGGSLPLLAVNDYDVPRASMDNYCVFNSNLFNRLRDHPETSSPHDSGVPLAPILSLKRPNLLHGPDGYICVTGSEPQISKAIPPVKPIRAVPPGKLPQNLQELFTQKHSDSNRGLGIAGSGLSKKGFLTNAETPLMLTKEFALDSTQEELLELMNDFKNNVYNLRELELLYENWKQRNDVQRDFKVRQKELKDIQKEYNKIQEKVKRESKKPGPISKLMKLMPGSRKKHSVGSGPIMGTSGTLREVSGEPPTSPPPPDDMERKVSGSSEPGSFVSEASILDSGVSDPDSLDPDRDKNRSSYVEPNPTGNLEKIIEMDGIQTLPNRPPKKTSLCMDGQPSVGSRSTSPGSPQITNENPMKIPIQTEPEVNQSNDTTRPPIPTKKMSQMNGGTAPPPPPPRIVAKPDSPFSYINYEGKTKGLMGFHSKPGPSPFPPPSGAANKSNQSGKRTYENERMDSKK